MLNVNFNKYQHKALNDLEEYPADSTSDDCCITKKISRFCVSRVNEQKDAHNDVMRASVNSKTPMLAVSDISSIESTPKDDKPTSLHYKVTFVSPLHNSSSFQETIQSQQIKSNPTSENNSECNIIEKNIYEKQDIPPAHVITANIELQSQVQKFPVQPLYIETAKIVQPKTQLVQQPVLLQQVIQQHSTETLGKFQKLEDANSVYKNGSDQQYQQSEGNEVVANQAPLDKKLSQQNSILHPIITPILQDPAYILQADHLHIVGNNKPHQFYNSNFNNVSNKTQSIYLHNEDNFM